MGISKDDLEKLVDLARSKWIREVNYRSLRDMRQKSETSLPEHILKRDFEEPFKKKAAELEAYSAPGLTKLTKEKIVLDFYKIQLQTCKDVAMDSEFLSDCYFCKNIYDKNEELQKKSEIPVVPDFWCKVKDVSIDSLGEDAIAGMCMDYDKSESGVGPMVASLHTSTGEEKIKIKAQIVAEQEAKYNALLAEREKQRNKLKFRM